eukprot:gb/GECG01010014.1/.p1 GENE.gb/GECG01010014.1/~~gb/GECG01010014.1/.p1  ORF type:complete len:166 (+),score=19.75 gb/GECG01010014.1/:1-498(+)
MKIAQGFGVWSPRGEEVLLHIEEADGDNASNGDTETIKGLVRGTMSSLPVVTEARLKAKQGGDASQKLRYGFLGKIEETEAGKIYCYQTFSGLRFVMVTTNDHINDIALKKCLKYFVDQYIKWQCNPFSDHDIATLQQLLLKICKESDSSLKQEYPREFYQYSSQ